MTVFQTVALLVLGLAAGFLSGLFGIGGGTIIVPGLAMVIGFDIKTATGTSLAAMLLPFAILGVIEYWKAGFVNFPAAGLLVLGLFAGAFFGAKVTLALPAVYVQRAFGVYMLAIGAKYLLTR